MDIRPMRQATLFLLIVKSQSYICVFELYVWISMFVRTNFEILAFTYVHKYGCTFVSNTPSINTLPHLNGELIWIAHAITLLTHIIWASERFALRSYRCFTVQYINAYNNTYIWESYPIQVFDLYDSTVITSVIPTADIRLEISVANQ